MPKDSWLPDYVDQAQLEQLLQTCQVSLTASTIFSDWLTLPPLTGLQLTVQPSVTSTNRELWLQSEQSDWHGRVLIAQQQAAGRGQFGRQWQSNLGGLYLSLSLRLQVPLAEASRLTYGVAWGLATALHDNAIPILLKWPNDVLLLNRKLGGILIETRVNPAGQIHQAVIGVGLNYSNAVPATGISLTAFQALQAEPSHVNSLAELASITLVGIWQGLRHWLQPSQSLGALLPSYEAWLAFQHQMIDVAGNSGRVLGVTTDGALRIRFGAIERQFPPGSLRFHPVANAQQWRCDLASGEERVLE